MKNGFKKICMTFLSLFAVASAGCDNGPWGSSYSVGHLIAMAYYPPEFVTEGRKYRQSGDGSVKVPLESVDEFYAYLTNEFEYERVKEHFNDDSIRYIVDPTNNVCGRGTDDIVGCLEVYTVKDSTDLAVFVTAYYVQFVLVESDGTDAS